MSNARTVYLRESPETSAEHIHPQLIAEGKDRRYYVLFGSSNWLCSFPTEAAAWQWLRTSPILDARGEPDISADDRWFELLGGEWPKG